MSALQIKLNNSHSIFALKNRSANESVEVDVLSGAKLKVTLFVKNLIGGPVKLRIWNSFSKDVDYREIETLTLSANGFKDVIVMDFHYFMRFDLEISGSADVSVGVSVKDDSRAGFDSNVEMIDELNRLVPEFYDDAEVMAETPKKQPTLIEFRKDGLTIRTIQITYLNEIFKRVQVL